jgi:hypothetical protein
MLYLGRSAARRAVRDGVEADRLDFDAGAEVGIAARRGRLIL